MTRIMWFLSITIALFTSRGLAQDACTVLMESNHRWSQEILDCAEQGSALAQYEVGFVYRYGMYGVTEDVAEALRWYMRAAEQGHASAQTSVGGFYENGYGITVDPVEAMKWYSLAAAQGDAYAQYYIGEMYDLEYPEYEGITKDDMEALRWYTLAAEQGQGDAQLTLALRYMNGRGGVIQDFVSAYMWVNLSASQETYNADYFRDQIANRMTAEQIAEAQKLSAEWTEEHDQ